MNTKLIYHWYKIKRKNNIKVRKNAKIRNQYKIKYLTWPRKPFWKVKMHINTSIQISTKSALTIQKNVFSEIFFAVYQTQTIYADWNNNAASYLIVEMCIDASVRLRTNNLIWLVLEKSRNYGKRLLKTLLKNKRHHFSTEVVTLKEHLLQCIKPSSFTTSSWSYEFHAHNQLAIWTLI